MKKIILLIASQGYQSHEYGVPKKILEESGFEAVTASNELGVAQASDGSSVNIDIAVENINVEDYNGLFIVGGPGALECLDNEKVHQLLQNWQESGKPYGAICISPRILAKAGVLRNKKATGWDMDNELSGIFDKYNVEYVRESVVVDGNVVTANGPMAAEEFGEKILEVLS